MSFFRRIVIFLSLVSFAFSQETFNSKIFLKTSIVEYPENSETQLKECLVEEVQLHCTSWRFAVEANNLSPWKRIPEDCVDYVKDYMTGRGYQFDIDRVSIEAGIYGRSVELSGNGKDVWIFDVDETLLSNLPYYAAHGYGLEIFDSIKFDEWVEKGMAPAIESCLKLYEEVLNLGFKVILLTGRSERHRNITTENLIKVGFHDWDKLILRSSEDHKKTALTYKSHKRNEMIEEGYRIWGNSGDQWSDLLGSSISDRSFKLPNPILPRPTSDLSKAPTLLLHIQRRRRRQNVSRDIEASIERKEIGGVVNTEDFLIKFQDVEDLTVHELLDAPGEVIGKSSYGTLYRASLVNSNSLTLLRFLRPTCTLRMKEVVPIIELLGSIRHPNLVPMKAFYAGPRGEKLLVHPFYGLGNLAQFIRDGNGEAHKWPIICRISIGIARGVHFLHTAFGKPVVHGNLKSKNILLDRNYQPYVSDFGLHLLLNPTAGQQMLEASASQGYKAPELIKMKDASEESDIYSLGVILLELLTGKEPIDENPSPDQDFYLPNVLRAAILDDRITDLYHPDILLSRNNDQMIVTEDHILRFFQLAMACCSPSTPLRPDIKQILDKLEEIAK
ncbi:Protein kinase domain-containing protein [Forsythia ovata]|uniref:Protein kinase domain-containing protein n=1 Tax=Forsythia ovata TaxID=205694 RepID=A0ABD1X8R7_9LAMI